MVVMCVCTHAKSDNSMSEREEVKQNPTAQNTQEWNADKPLHSENGNFGLISHRLIFLVRIVGESMLHTHAISSICSSQKGRNMK